MALRRNPSKEDLDVFDVLEREGLLSTPATSSVNAVEQKSDTNPNGEGVPPPGEEISHDQKDIPGAAPASARPQHQPRGPSFSSAELTAMERGDREIRARAQEYVAKREKAQQKQAISSPEAQQVARAMNASIDSLTLENSSDSSSSLWSQQRSAASSQAAPRPNSRPSSSLWSQQRSAASSQAASSSNATRQQAVQRQLIHALNSFADFLENEPNHSPSPKK